jgi:NADPH-dependent 2,4-dienoyl-CoA reductase/sulfur reductase-like enzyme
MTPHIAVVGASLGGSRTVRMLRQRGYVGRITLIGAEPHRPYDRPPLSKGFLTADEATPKYLEAGDLLDSVEMRLNVRAVALRLGDREIETDDGHRIRVDHVVVATGAAARRLPGDSPRTGVHTLRTLDDAEAIRRGLMNTERVVIVGAGFIGCEVAAAARDLGVDVVMVDPGAAPVVRGVGTKIGTAVADLHRAHGVDLRLRTSVTRVEGVDRVRAVQLSDGSRITTDMLIVGIGANPQTGWLTGSGVNLNDGVVCDRYCRAVGGGGHVWVVGDVARWHSTRYNELLRLEHWTNAAEQGAHVAANILAGDAVTPYDPLPYVWSDQYGSKFQILGRIQPDYEIEVLSGSLCENRYLVGFFKSGLLRGVLGRSMPTLVARYRSLLTEPADHARAREGALMAT